MKGAVVTVFVAGATGGLGGQLVAHAHEVVGITRSSPSAASW